MSCSALSDLICIEVEATKRHRRPTVTENRERERSFQRQTLDTDCVKLAPVSKSRTLQQTHSFVPKCAVAVGNRYQLEIRAL